MYDLKLVDIYFRNANLFKLFSRQCAVNPLLPNVPQMVHLAKILI